MKKIKFICFLLFVSIAAIAQTPFPSVSKNGNTNGTTLNKSLGGLQADSLFINAVYLDTTAANRSPYNKTYIGGQIYTTSDSSIWLWQGKWIKAKGGSGGGSPYTITKNATRDTIILSDGSNITKIKDSVGGVPSLTSKFIGIGNSSNNLSGRFDFSLDFTTNIFKAGTNAGLGNTASNFNGFGINAGRSNTGLNFNGLGSDAGAFNTYNDVTLFGQNSTASNNKQIVFNNGIFNARYDYNLILDSSVLYTMPNKSGTIALLSDITGGGGGGTVDTQYLRRDINLRFDSLRNNAGILEGRKNGVFIPQLSLLNGGVTFYNTNGTLTSPRRVNGNGYLLKFDSTKVSFADTSNIAGHLYDFNNGVSFVDYNATNTSSLIQTEISGVKFSTNDRNNLDTSNYLWAKTDKVELFSTNRIDINSRTFYPATYTTAGTTGNQTINKNSGSVNIAPAITTITVTNNLVTANTIVTARVSSNDATAEILNVVSVTNGFIITMSTPATNEAQIKFWITN